MIKIVVSLRGNRCVSFEHCVSKATCIEDDETGSALRSETIPRRVRDQQFAYSYHSMRLHDDFTIHDPPFINNFANKHKRSIPTLYP